MKKQAIFPAIGMLILILDGKTALEGAGIGLSLCLQTLIPSLLPFLVLSIWLTGNLTGHPMRIFAPMGRMMGIPAGGESFLMAGFLGGYPAGAQNIAAACRSGVLNRKEAERLLALCNQAGPSFLFGILPGMFADIRIVWLLWLMQIVSVLLIGILTREDTYPITSGSGNATPLTQAVRLGIQAMAMICGWVILFRILLSFLEKWILWLLPASFQVLICGILELSNGCLQLGEIGCEGLRFILAGVMLSFGGVCVTMQTYSAAATISMKRYLSMKLMQALLCGLLCTGIQFTFPPESQWDRPMVFLIFLAGCVGLLARNLKRNKKISSIPAASGV